jgi:hypothetical protein
MLTTVCVPRAQECVWPETCSGEIQACGPGGVLISEAAT